MRRQLKQPQWLQQLSIWDHLKTARGLGCLWLTLTNTIPGTNHIFKALSSQHQDLLPFARPSSLCQVLFFSVFIYMIAYHARYRKFRRFVIENCLICWMTLKGRLLSQNNGKNKPNSHMNKFIFTLMLGSVFSRGFVFRYHAGKVSVTSLSLFIRKHCVHGIGHRKKIRKLTFRALAFSRSKSRNCGLCVVI